MRQQWLLPPSRKSTARKPAAKAPAAKSTPLIKGTKFPDTGKGQRLDAEALLAKDPSLAFKPTPAAVVKARDGGLRWIRIATFGGITVERARELYAQGAGRPASRLPGKPKSAPASSTSPRRTVKVKKPSA